MNIADKIISDMLDRAEEIALQRADKAAYESSENVKSDMKRKVYDALKANLGTGIRLMREAISEAIRE